MSLLEVRRDDVGPILVDAGRFDNNSSEGAQGLAKNLNLPSMEQILTVSLPSSNYIPKDAINADALPSPLLGPLEGPTM